VDAASKDNKEHDAASFMASIMKWLTDLRLTETGEENGTPRRNEYDVDEDDGGRDNHELEAPRRSTTFVTRLA